MNILELAHQIGLTPKWTCSTAGGEYHSACPMCGGTDRFYIQPHRQMRNCTGYYCCRQCGTYGDSIEFARQFLNLSFQESVTTVNAIIPEKTFVPSIKKSTPSPKITLQKPPTQWITNAIRYVMDAHERLLLQEDVLSYLSSRGLPIDAVKRYKLGWSDNDEYLCRSDWGLHEDVSHDGKKRTLWIPKGIVIPTIETNGEVVRLKVRRHDYNEDDSLPKYVAISGSMNGLSIVGRTAHNTMVVVESELDAYAIHNVAHDVVFIVAIGSNIKNPDNLTDHLATNKPHLLICYDNDPAGLVMLKKWQSLYTHARPYSTPIGKDIGEAIMHGCDIRAWLLQETTQE